MELITDIAAKTRVYLRYFSLMGHSTLIQLHFYILQYWAVQIFTQYPKAYFEIILTLQMCLSNLKFSLTSPSYRLNLDSGCLRTVAVVGV